MFLDLMNQGKLNIVRDIIYWIGCYLFVMTIQDVFVCSLILEYFLICFAYSLLLLLLLSLLLSVKKSRHIFQKILKKPQYGRNEIHGDGNTI